jgi:hypothetical protein
MVHNLLDGFLDVYMQANAPSIWEQPWHHVASAQCAEDEGVCYVIIKVGVSTKSTLKLFACACQQPFLIFKEIFWYVLSLRSLAHPKTKLSERL